MGSTNFFRLYSCWEILKNACERKEVLKLAKENSLTNIFHGFEHPGNLVKWLDLQLPLRKKCPCSELFWSAFFPHFPAFGLNTERYGEYLSVFSPNAGKCGKNADQITPNTDSFYAMLYKSKRLQVFVKNMEKIWDFIILSHIKIRQWSKSNHLKTIDSTIVIS